MSKEVVYLEKLRLKIINQLNNRGFVFLIKTGDFALDEFFKSKIKDGLLNVRVKNQLEYFKEIEKTQNDPTQYKNYDFITIQSINEELLNTLTNISDTSETKTINPSIFYLPKFIIYRFFEHKSVDEFLSSSIFISEELDQLGPLIAKRSLEILYDGTFAPALQNHFLDQLNNKKISISKLIFYASVHKPQYLRWSENPLIDTVNVLSIETFLNERGKEFIAYFFKKISLNTIEAFFRSFIFVERENFTASSLSFEKISSITQALEPQLKQLLELATSPQFQILAEEDGFFTFKISEYLIEWSDLNQWIKKEEATFKQHKQLEALAKDYFQSGGPLLSKEQIEQATNWREDNLPGYRWEEKYKIDEGLISSYIVLSENNLEESLKKQQKKRSRLLKNSIRISVAVSIAFLLSSFTALIAYLERNSALKQQELAIQAKEDADQARVTAENERHLAEEARQNETVALQKAEFERMLALESKGQAELQRKNALNALDMAEKSALEASLAKEIAEKNEQLANEAREVAQINFKTSERLRNQQEARAASLEALGHFANENYDRGLLLAQTAFEKNLLNGGFPLQSDIFFALLYSKLSSKESKLEVNLEHPAKFLALSDSKNKLAVYTINGEIQIFTTSPNLELTEKLQTGYIQSMAFISETEILYTSIEGKLLSIGLQNTKPNYYNEKVAEDKYRALFKIPSHENIWIATSQNGGSHLLNYQKTNDFFKINERSGEKIQAMAIRGETIVWAEGNKMFYSNLFDQKSELLFTAASEISSIIWSEIHNSWILGLTNGQLLNFQPNSKKELADSFLIHGSKISQLKVIPYVYNTELLFSTGFDGSIYIYVLDRNLPFSTSISSRISFPKHRSWITGFVTDPERQLAYSISNDRSLKIWPMAIEELLKKH